MVLVSSRLALLHVGTFLFMGLFLPFWPVWLEGEGLGPTEIGILLSVGAWTRVIANPFVGQFADSTGHRKYLLVTLAALTVASFMLFQVAGTFWQFLAISLLASTAFAAVIPLGDNLTLLAVRQRGIDYGRVRMWGSVAFIAASSGGGWLIARNLFGTGVGLIYWLMIATLAFLLFAAVLSPDLRSRRSASGGGQVLALLRQRRFIAFLFTAALIQASHAVLYAFGTIHWREYGIDETVIGILWAEGVIAEIILFAFSAPLLRRLGPMGLIVLGAAAGVVRWTGTALDPGLPALFVLQSLHAFTFAATHIGAMHYINRTVDTDLSATAMSLFSGAGIGVFMGIAMAASGELYQALGGAAFFVMTGVSLAGLGISLWLGFRYGDFSTDARGGA